MRQPTSAHTYQNDTDEKRASWRRRNHADIEAMQNLIVSAVAMQTGHEMPPKCRLLLSAIQGAHGGGSVVNEEFERSYLALADQLQFVGSDEARRARVRDWINALDEWQANTFLLVAIKKGGEIIGYNEDGVPIRKATTFIDLVKPIADAAVVRARASAQWRVHPGKALAAQVASAVGELSRHPDYETAPLSEIEEAHDEPTEEDEVNGRLKRLSLYAEGRRNILIAESKRVADKFKDDEPTSVDEIDGRLAALEVHYARVRKQVESDYQSARAALLSLRSSRCRRMMNFTDPEEVAREVDERINAPKGDAPPASWLNKAISDTQARHGESRAGNGYYRMRDFSNLPDGEVEEVIGDEGGLDFSHPPAAEISVKEAEIEPDMCAAALWWASRGVAVFPLHKVFDDVCSCAAGSECKSKGKHPMTARGLKEATTDEATIRRWWTKHPRANIGGVMGGSLRLVAVDVDPKSGGSASLADLADARGDEWLNTFTQETGSRGFHFFFTYPEDVELRNSAGKLAPGIDTRAAGGYVCLAPSLHASGRRYGLTNEGEIKPAPQWLIDDLTRKPHEQPVDVIDFQERKASRSGSVIGEGERNDKLFRVGCGIWGGGGALHKSDLYDQLLEINIARVSPPLVPSEVIKIVESIMRYPRGVPIQEGATV
jgi:hypothetical protein